MVLRSGQSVARRLWVWRAFDVLSLCKIAWIPFAKHATNATAVQTTGTPPVFPTLFERDDSASLGLWHMYTINGITVDDWAVTLTFAESLHTPAYYLAEGDRYWCTLSQHQDHFSLEKGQQLHALATAGRRYTGDIHNSIIIGLSMPPTGQWKRLGLVMVECTCLLHIALL